jgi:hypothetical protein
MGLFDAFSADDETRKFEQGLNYQTKQLGTADKRINQNFATARGDLQAGQTAGVNYLQDQNAIARGDITGAQTAGQGYLTDQNAIARGDITSAQDMGMGLLQQGADTAAGFYDQALTPWQQLSGLGTQGVQDHYNLISNPDSIYDSELYKSREQATIDGLNREANSRGMLSSGNNSQDIIDYMRQGGLDYFKTLTNEYAPYFGLATGGAAGIGNVLGQKAGLYDRLGQNQAGLAQWAGGQLSGLGERLGQNQSALAQWGGGLLSGQAANLGTQLGNMATGTASQLADSKEIQGSLLSGNRAAAGAAGADAYGNIANAQNAADAMGWNALLGLTSGIGDALSSYTGAGGSFA